MLVTGTIKGENKEGKNKEGLQINIQGKEYKHLKKQLKAVGLSINELKILLKNINFTEFNIRDNPIAFSFIVSQINNLKREGKFNMK